MSTISWNSIGDQSKSAKKSDDVIFLNSKNLPQVFLPGPDIVKYEAFYDETTKKNRTPQPSDPDDKVRTQYLFYGLFSKDGKKVVKICCSGYKVAEGIGSVLQTTEKLMPGNTTFVKVSSSGSGLQTDYKVEVEASPSGKNVPKEIWNNQFLKEEVAKLPTLVEMRDKLLGVKKEEEAPDIGAVAGVKNNDLDI